ncbi:MAG: hypothetical protein J0I47_04360 [Sphingomonas sp.]|nr:hypothetical protein [Sphingomonas sp.]MBN8807457.1 hypothetical protein [Sphingomonas sp.]
MLSSTRRPESQKGSKTSDAASYKQWIDRIDARMTDKMVRDRGFANNDA